MSSLVSRPHTHSVAVKCCYIQCTKRMITSHELIAYELVDYWLTVLLYESVGANEMLPCRKCDAPANESRCSATRDRRNAVDQPIMLLSSS